MSDARQRAEEALAIHEKIPCYPPLARECTCCAMDRALRDIIAVLDRIEAERAAREKAEARLHETEGWHKAAVRERDLMREQMDEILGYEDIETPGPDENVASVVLAAMDHLRWQREQAVVAREKAEREAQTWRELCDHRAFDLIEQDACVARLEEALRRIAAGRHTNECSGYGHDACPYCIALAALAEAVNS